MELSPLARERLAKAGELSPEEKERLKLNEQLGLFLADYFTGGLDSDGLWLKLKPFRDNGKQAIIKETQIRLIRALSLASSDIDFERCRKGILACESLKDLNRSTDFELVLNSLETLRRQYRQEIEKTFNSMKVGMQQQISAAAQKMSRQRGGRNVSIDVDGSVEASVRASPQWRNFALRHENDCNQKFEALLGKMERLV